VPRFTRCDSANPDIGRYLVTALSASTLSLKQWVKGDLRRRQASAGHITSTEQIEGGGVEHLHSVRHGMFLYFLL
jgi:hypothetical protein